jgi:hypothetical protein
MPIREREELLGHPIVGASWEGMVIENVLVPGPLALRHPPTDHLRGAEIDLIIEFGTKDRWAIEVVRPIGKPAPSKGSAVLPRLSSKSEAKAVLAFVSAA